VCGCLLVLVCTRFLVFKNCAFCPGVEFSNLAVSAHTLGEGNCKIEKLNIMTQKRNFGKQQKHAKQYEKTTKHNIICETNIKFAEALSISKFDFPRSSMICAQSIPYPLSKICINLSWPHESWLTCAIKCRVFYYYFFTLFAACLSKILNLRF